MKRPKIVVVGSSNTDMVIKLERIPEPGETVLSGQFSMAAGGKGANQAVAAARAGGEVVLVACVGDDMFGEQALEGFLRDGINIEYISRDGETPSGIALIFVDEDGENSIGVASGANTRLRPAHVDLASSAITSADILITQLETPMETVSAAAEMASRHGVRVILNPAPACPLDDSLIECVSILTPNESEAELLTGIEVEGKDGMERAASALLSKGLQSVLITLGARGVYVATEDLRRAVPGFAVRAVDTTAAGDVFNGALAVALAEDRPWLEAVRFASGAAALSTTRLGAQPSAPLREEIEKFLQARDETR